MGRKGYIVIALIFALISVIVGLKMGGGSTSSKLEITMDKGDFYDDSKALRLKLKRGGVMEIPHQYGQNELEHITYKPIGRIKALGIYLVQVVANEASVIIFYDDTTGKEMGRVDGYEDKLRFAPSGKYMVYIYSDESGYTFSGVQVFEVAPHAMKEVLKIKKEGLEFVEFGDGESFTVRYNPLLVFRNGESEERVVFKDKNSKVWQMTELE